MDTSGFLFLVPLAAICLPVVGLAVILGFILILKYLRLKETEMLLASGVSPETIERQRAERPSRAALFAGLIVSMVGLALSIALYPIGFIIGSRFPLGLGPWMIAGFLPLFIGVALILWHYLSNSPEDRGGGRHP